MVEQPAPVVRDNRSSRGCLMAALAPLGVVVAVMLVYAAWAALTGKAPELRSRVTTCVQPDDVSYADGRYEVAIIDTTSLSLGSGETEAVVGREGDGGTYGVFVDLGSSGYPEDVTCRWTPDQVEVVEPGGIVHVVPASVFMGGR